MPPPQPGDPLLTALRHLAAVETDAASARSSNWQERVAALRELRSAVSRIARARRAEGVPIERVIVELKELLNGALREAPVEIEAGPIRDKVVTWCSAAYFSDQISDDS